MKELQRGLAASRADEQEQGAEERQLQEALRSSRLDQADVSTASEAEEETASEIEIEKGKLARQPIEKPQLKRKAEHHLTNPREKAGRRLEPPALSTSSMRYSGGAIRITRTPGRQQAGNCVNLEDIIDKRSLVSACVFSFYIGDQELFRHLPLSRSTNSVPIYIGRDANMDPMVETACVQSGVTMKGKITRKQLDTMLPALDRLNKKQHGENYHCFYAWSSGSSHSKVLALVYPTFLRIVITSCNMMDIDTVGGDNHWYIHDLPKISDGQRAQPGHFEVDFLAHLRALQTPEDFVESIEGAYDYSGVKVHLATSVPGSWSGVKAEQHGLLRLRKIVKSLDLDLTEAKVNGRLQLEVCAASIGHLNSKWLNGFYDCALGKNDLVVATPSDKVPEVKVFYPTVGDVKSADEDAQQGASNIGCHTRPWNAAPRDIKDLFHHYESKDSGRLFHQKLILAYNNRNTTAPPYYVYLGSANLSQSAWGALEVDKKANVATCSTKMIKMSNFECGAVVPGHLIQGLLEPGTASWAEGIVPYNQNAPTYDHKHDRPWNDPRWVKDYREDWNSGK